MIGQHAPFDQPWTLSIIHLPDPGNNTDINYPCPPDARLEIIAVDGLLDIQLLGNAPRLTMHINRNGRTRSRFQTNVTLSPSTTWNFQFSIRGRDDLNNKTDKIHFCPLPHEMWMEPSDSLQIIRTNPNVADAFHLVTVTAKLYRLQLAPNKLRRITRAFFE